MGLEPQPALTEPTVNEERVPPKRKQCSICGENKPLSDFLRRTGRRSGKGSRRGTCRSCRKAAAEEQGQARNDSVREGDANSPPAFAGDSFRADVASLPSELWMPPPGGADTDDDGELPPPAPKRRVKRPLPEPPPRPDGPDASVLQPTRQGIVRMRGRTDKGRRWHQETDLETAVTLVREHAAVVVNRHTIRRLYSNKKFRQYILTRDQYTCHFCGEYGDTIDHLLPRAKGGHTTPVNCVCACNLCNQSKADRSLDEFMESEL